MADDLDILCTEFGQCGLDAELITTVFFDCGGSLQMARMHLREMTAPSAVSPSSESSLTSMEKSARSEKKSSNRRALSTSSSPTSASSSSGKSSSPFSETVASDTHSLLEALCDVFPSIHSRVLESILDECAGDVDRAVDLCHEISVASVDEFTESAEEELILEQLMSDDADDAEIARILQENEEDHAALYVPFRINAWDNRAQSNAVVAQLKSAEFPSLLSAAEQQKRAAVAEQTKRKHLKELHSMQQQSNTKAMARSAHEASATTAKRQMDRQLEDAAAMRGTYYQLALHAYRNGDAKRAKELARLGKQYDESCFSLQEARKNEICRHAQSVFRDESLSEGVVYEVDLHGFHVTHACDLAERMMMQLQQSSSGNSFGKRRSVRFIVGRGSHSNRGRSRIAPALMELVRSRGWKTHRSQDGCIDISCS